MTDTVFFVGGECLGGGDDELGRALMLSALGTAAKLPDGPPSRILFMNGGVKLCCPGSPALETLGALADAGTELLCCGTCLDWFDLKGSLAVGRESNMLEILGAMDAAGRVVRL